MIKKVFATTLLLCSCIAAFAQQKYLDRKVLDRITDSVQAEGKALYRSEWASWYGTDIFIDKCKDKKDDIGGYISYETKAGMYNVFYAKGDTPNVIGTIFFGNDFNAEKYTLDTATRQMSALEHDYYSIRKAATERMRTDTIFKFYKNANLNPVPMIRNGSKRVYVLTGPNVNGVVLFGNDYQIDFDKKGEIRSVKKIHNTLIAVKSGKEQDSSKTVLGVIHSHIKGKDPFITATDICTMMLYHHFTTWNTLTIISKDYVSNWDCNRNQLVILTMEAWNKINGVKNTLEATKQ